MSFKRFLALFLTRNKEFIRDRSSLSWNILMPVLIVAGFSFAFSGDIGKQFKVGVINKSTATESSQQFLKLKHIEFYSIESDKKAVSHSINKVQRHQVDLLLDAEKQQYWINTESPKGYLVEKILLGEKQLESLNQNSRHQDSLHHDFSKQTVSGKQIRYIDWVIPGILSMNMMFSALFGVGFVICVIEKMECLNDLKQHPLLLLNIYRPKLFHVLF